MYKLVYYIEDEIVEENEVQEENLEEAFCSASNFDSDALSHREDQSDDVSCLAGVLDPDDGWLIWFNTDGERGSDYDKDDDVGKLIEEYLKW